MSPFPRKFQPLLHTASVVPWLSVTRSKASLTVAVPLPTTLIFADVLAEVSDLNNQKTQVMSIGTLVKNFLDWETKSRIGERHQ
jgi:hypothetical protein